MAFAAGAESFAFPLPCCCPKREVGPLETGEGCRLHANLPSLGALCWAPLSLPSLSCPCPSGRRWRAGASRLGVPRLMNDPRRPAPINTPAKPRPAPPHPPFMRPSEPPTRSLRRPQKGARVVKLQLAPCCPVHLGRGRVKERRQTQTTLMPSDTPRGRPPGPQWGLGEDGVKCQAFFPLHSTSRHYALPHKQRPSPPRGPILKGKCRATYDSLWRRPGRGLLRSSRGICCRTAPRASTAGPPPPPPPSPVPPTSPSPPNDSPLETRQSGCGHGNSPPLWVAVGAKGCMGKR